MGEEFGPLAHEVHPTPQEIAGGTHVCGIDVGDGDQAAAEEGGDLVGVKALTEVGEPVPGEHALGGHGDILAVGSDDPEERLRTGAEVLVDLDVSGLVEDTEVEGAGVEIDTAVVPVLLGVGSHRGLLLEG